MESFVFGHTSQNLPIFAYQFGQNTSSKAKKVLILAATHGDEIESVVVAQKLIETFMVSFPFDLKVTIVPTLNLDGVLLKRRWNARGVDLNRNLPTKDWTPKILNPRYPPGPAANSEPENQALVSFIKREKPHIIFSLHSWHPVLLYNGNCLAEAQVLHQWTGYPVQEDKGDETPGCLGTFGPENGIPVLTYEVERDLSIQDILKIHPQAMEEVLKFIESKK